MISPDEFTVIAGDVIEAVEDASIANDGVVIDTEDVAFITRFSEFNVIVGATILIESIPKEILTVPSRFCRTALSESSDDMVYPVMISGKKKLSEKFFFL